LLESSVDVPSVSTFSGPRKLRASATRAALIVFAITSCALAGQQTKRSAAPADRADIHHHGSSGIVFAISPRPLLRTIKAVRDEYAWFIDYEEPPYYSSYDLVDNTDPVWRSNHPNEKGVHAAVGGSFLCEYPEGPNTAASVEEEEKILKKLVDCYNRSGNPGKFTVVREARRHFAIIGESLKDDNGRDVHVTPFLDTPISIPRAERTADETLDLIVAELYAKTGIKCIASLGSFWPSPLWGAHITLGGDNVSARDLLRSVFKVTAQPFNAELLYDSDAKEYNLLYNRALETPAYFPQEP
jgi:hypothetical protein